MKESQFRCAECDEVSELDNTVIRRERGYLCAKCDERSASTIKMNVKNSNGVEFDCAGIGDLWHIAMGLDELEQAMVLHVWHQAHAMRHTLFDIRRKARDWGEWDADETLEFVQAIAYGEEL